MKFAFDLSNKTIEALQRVVDAGYELEEDDTECTIPTLIEALLHEALSYCIQNNDPDAIAKANTNVERLNEMTKEWRKEKAIPAYPLRQI